MVATTPGSGYAPTGSRVGVVTVTGTSLRVIRLLLRLGVLSLAAFGAYVLYLRLGRY
jgi:hypothetical protein